MKQLLSLYKTNFYMVTTNGNVFLPYNTDKRFFIYTKARDETFLFGCIPNHAYDFLAKCMNDHDKFSLYVSQSNNGVVRYVLILNHVFKTKAELLSWIESNVRVDSRYIIIDHRTTMMGELSHED